MPARSNDLQAVVYFIRKNLAADATVTESAQLRDRVTGRLREVDVLVASHIAGHPLQIGIECRGRSRKDAVSWEEVAAGRRATDAGYGLLVIFAMKA
ncbi:hypothetical protein [Nonomuraea turcica]|uniref:hypothetical protein n=1 Tax=Nonomuraea sp. G32 TaxID=3067274 RepID=UPI00273B1200|nr:hypothetical protein [Nonomuraea sp. G32]MDP4509382.1 hypothetical protein [Nonomuraea sp. G32]